MKSIKRITAIVLALVLAFSCFTAIANAAPVIKSIRIVQKPTKLTFYKDTDWDYGYWRFSDSSAKGKFYSDPNRIAFLRYGGYYSNFSEIGVLDMRGLIVEVTYSDGSKKNVEYKETVSGVNVRQNILFSLQKKLTLGQNVIEIYFAENTDVYTTFTITIANKQTVKGDVNGDMIVNSSDALSVLRHVVGSAKLSGEKLAAADVNADGVINSSDALAILRIAVA